MPTKKNTTERFNDFGVHGKFGKAWEYGERVYGEQHYGVEEEEWDRNEYGFKTYGKTEYGSDDKRWGVYQQRSEQGKTFISRENFRTPSNPQSVAQTTQRNKMTPAWIWYNAKTDQQKKEDQKNGSKIGLTGPQFSMREYLKTH